MMSTTEADSTSSKLSSKCDNSKSGQGSELPKLDIVKSDSDSGLGSSDSSDSMCDVKDSFQEAIMNLKALNGSGDGEISDIKETQLPKPDDLVKEVSQNGKDSLKEADKANGDNMSASDSPLPAEQHDEDQNGANEEESPNENTRKASKDSSPEPDEQTKDIAEDTASEPVQCEDQTENQMEEKSEDPTEHPSEEASEEASEEVSQDAPSQESVDEHVDADAPTEDKDNIEIVDSDNEDLKETVPAADDDVMIVSGKDERSNDSESSDHPLTIGDKVKKSVRDIMSKLKQGISPELNKILVKPKQEETMETDTSEAPSDSKPAEAKPLLESPRKGNLFENLTVIGARTENSIKMEVKGAEVKDEQNDSKTSHESDVELIEDSDFDKKDDDIIIFDDKPSSGQNSATQDMKDMKLEEDAKSSISLVSSDINAKPKQEDLKKAVKDEVKTISKSEPTTVEKPMEIDDDDEDDDDESDNVKPLIKITPPSDKSEESSEPCAVARNERKRSQDSQSGDGGPPKRSRLDMVIGKLGSQIGISPETIKCDSSDEDSRQCSDTSEKSEDNLSSVSDEEDDKTSQSSTKTVRISGKELEAVVRSKVSAYLKAHRDSKMDALRARVEELQTANETWKSQAKELQKQVLDLTVLQQRLEKRKAATAALRQITTRSVGIQADDTKTNFATGQAVKVAKTPPKAAAPATNMTITAPLLSNTVTTGTTSSTSLQGVVMTTTQVLPTSSVNRNSVTQLLSATAVSRNPPTQPTIIGSPAMAMTQGVRPQLAQHLSSTVLTSTLGNSLTSVRSLLDTSKTIDTISKLQTVPGQALSGSNVIVVSSPTLSTQAPKGIPKIIDLTSDDDSAKGPAASQQSRTVQVVPGTSVSALRPGLVQQQSAVIRGMNPLTLQQSLPTGTSILLSSPHGLVSPGTTNLTRPGGTFQIVTVASGSNLRPGTLLTVVPAGSSVTTPQTQIRSAIPSVLPVARPAVPAVAPTMPQLRPVTPLTTMTVSAPAKPVSSAPTVTSRPPPPLQTAPAVSIVSPDNTGTGLTPPPQKHPAPLPPRPGNQPTKGLKGLMPPKPGLKISRVSQGIVLSWNMTVNDNHADIESYQLFAYQESSTAPSTSLWKKVGNVKALPLPMACTLTQFQEGNKYHFSVRAVDIHNRLGDFSDPSTIHLTPK